MPQPLPSKERSLFSQVVKNFESKQYKKGIKAAEQILRKVPNHGDTQAMKALLLNSLGETEEAFALAKVALKNDMKSHVPWHVYGLLWRSAKNFEESIKAYKFALKLEPDSVQILRDLTFLQIQTRDHLGHIQSRTQALHARPALRQNWTSTAVAHHLAGDLAQAEKLLTAFEDTLKILPSKTDIEHSEACLYKNTIIAQSGDIQRAYDHLQTIKKANLDRTAVMELEAKYLLKLGRMSEAEKAYRDLIVRNSEYRTYYKGLEKALGLGETDRDALKDLYSSYAQKYERLDAARRIPLDFLQGDDFRDAADHYLRRMLEKGVPSTFNNVKALYTDESKKAIIEALVEDYASGKQTNGGSNGTTNGGHSDLFEESVLYFLTQHYNYKLSRNLKKAMEFVEKIIELKPKTYDYHMTKARILKHHGNPGEAAKTMNYARELDLKDRYINTKCAKYQLRNDENKAALNTMSLFTRNETIGGPLGDLVEMQSLWFITEDGEANLRQGKLGKALKRFHSVFDIFEIWQEDQFDFHSFSFRKGQVRAYVDMIRFEDRLREHPFYTRAAIDAVKIYIRLYDQPELAQEGYIPGLENMNDAERKKASKQLKKQQEKYEKEDAERVEADQRAAAKKANASPEGELKKIDKDPRGVKLIHTKEPLNEAMKFLTPLLEFGSDNLNAQHLGFEVLIRRKKYFLALKCLLAAFAIEPSNAVTHEQTLRFFFFLLKESSSDSASTAMNMATSNLPSFYGKLGAQSSLGDLIALNDEFLSSQPANGFSVITCSRLRQLLDPSSVEESRDAIIKTLSGEAKLSLEESLEALHTLKELGAQKAESEGAAEQVKARYPEATIIDRVLENGFE